MAFNSKDKAFGDSAAALDIVAPRGIRTYAATNEQTGSSVEHVTGVHNSLEALAENLEARAADAKRSGNKAESMSEAFLKLGAALRKLAIAYFRMGRGLDKVAKGIRDVVPFLKRAKEQLRKAEGDHAALNLTLAGLTEEAGSLTAAA